MHLTPLWLIISVFSSSLKRGHKVSHATSLTGSMILHQYLIFRRRERLEMCPIQLCKHALASWASQIANYIEDFIVFGAATWRWILRPVWVKPSRPSIVSPAIKVQLWCGHNKIYADLCLREGRRSLYRWSWSCFYPVRIWLQCRWSCFPYDDFYDLQIEHKRGGLITTN